MAIQTPLLLFLTAFLHYSSAARAQIPTGTPDLLPVHRNDFPSDFIFGTASSAYQYEGASNKSYKEKSIWDTFVEEYPEKIVDHSNASIADDFYDLFQGDVQRMGGLGFEAFRFSISWSRLLNSNTGPNITLNPEGVEFYQNLTNIIVSEGLKPVVTLFHWDTPQELETAYESFLHKKIQEDFLEFANISFSLFGDRVKHWITFNEPHNFCQYGYATGDMAPGRCTSGPTNSGFRVGRYRNGFLSDERNCTAGNSSTEPYKVAHHILLAHAHTFRFYKKHYAASQNGSIGITLNVDWMLPHKPTSQKDIDAAQRALDFHYGWFMNPITYGEYPDEMVKRVGDRLPKFTLEESQIVKKSYDFIGLNYYTTSYAIDIPCPPGPKNYSYLTDACVNITKDRDGVPIGCKGCSDWLYDYAPGIRYLMNYTKNKYENPMVIITENGFDLCNTGTIQQDPERIRYHHGHLLQLSKFIKETPESNVKGYLLWSFLDNFEWDSGYTVRFGIVYVNYSDPNLNRTNKDSATWFQKFLKPNETND